MKRINWAAACVVAAACAAVGSLSWPADHASGAAPAATPPATRAATPTQPAAAEPAGSQPAEDKPPVIVIRVYDVADLVRTLRDFPFDSALIPPTMIGRDRQSHGSGAGAGGGGGGGLFGSIIHPATAGPSLEEKMKEIEDLITQTVASESWREQGGSVGSIRPVGTTLVISQTAENLRDVEKLLAEVRKARRVGTNVGVDAHWVLVAPRELRGLLKKGRDGVGPASPAAGAEVDAAALDGLEPKGLHTEAHLSCQNGQTVHVASGRGHTAEVSADVEIGTATSAYQPEIEQLLAGTVLEVKVRLDGETAVVDVSSVVTDWDPPGDPIRLTHRGEATLAATQPSDYTVSGKFETSTPIDRLNVPAQQFATTVRVPLGRPVLVGGMTYEPSASAKGGDGRQLYLVLRVSATEPGGR